MSQVHLMIFCIIKLGFQISVKKYIKYSVNILRKLVIH